MPIKQFVDTQWCAGEWLTTSPQEKEEPKFVVAFANFHGVNAASFPSVRTRSRVRKSCSESGDGKHQLEQTVIHLCCFVAMLSWNIISWSLFLLPIYKTLKGKKGVLHLSNPSHFHWTSDVAGWRTRVIRKWNAMCSFSETWTPIRQLPLPHLKRGENFLED